MSEKDFWRCDISVCVVYAKMGAKNVGIGKESENSDDLKPVKSGQGGRSAFDFIKNVGGEVRWRWCGGGESKTREEEEESDEGSD